MRARAAAAAAVLYLVVALWAMRVVLAAPASTFPYSPNLAPEGGFATVSHSDQMFVAWGVVRNVRAFLTRPRRLFDGEQCYPAPRAVTLGESMFGDGLLGVVPYVLTRDPILTMNAVVVLALWLPAIAMYALVVQLTGSAGAALIAGLLFGFHPTRVVDPGHPYVYGDYWTPFALLFAHRLFARARWADAAGLTASVCLQLLESLYQIIALVLLGAVIGATLLVHHRRRLPQLLPKLAVAASLVAGFMAALTYPYLMTQRAWGILGGRFSLLHPLGHFAPGGPAFPGAVMLFLTLVALVDRFWHRRVEDDPRLPYLVGGLAVFWFVVWFIPVPGLRVKIPSLAIILGRIFPGLDAVRGLQYARLGVYLAGAFLAGWGAWALLRRCGALGRAALTAVLAAGALLEVFAPPLARRSFSVSVEMVAYRVRPDPALLTFFDRLPAGAVLDLPFELNLVGELRDMAHYVFLSAFHDHPVAACFNSYKLPIDKDIAALARRLSDPRAADALAALGFGSIVLHEELEPERVARVRGAIDELVRGGRLTPVGEAAGHRVYRLSSPLPVDASLAALAPGGSPAGDAEARAPLARIEFAFRNTTDAIYRHPDPIVPAKVLVRWYADGGALAAEQHTRLLLPLALAPGEEAVRAFVTPVPTGPGLFEVTLAPETAPERVLARQRVRVEPS